MRHAGTKGSGLSSRENTVIIPPEISSTTLYRHEMILCAILCVGWLASVTFSQVEAMNTRKAAPVAGGPLFNLLPSFFRFHCSNSRLHDAALAIALLCQL